MFHNSLLSCVASFVGTAICMHAMAQPTEDQVIAVQRQMFEKIPAVVDLLERDADVKRRFENWLKVSAREQIETLADAAPTNPDLRQELLSRMKRDQEVRKNTRPDEWEKVDKANQQRLKEIIAEYGWSGKSLVGRDGANAAWMIAQHAIGDRPFQQQCLRLMNAAPKTEVSLRDVAYLVDRVREEEGQLQLFGTQFKHMDGRVILNEVADPAKLNQIREQAAMMPIEVYLLFANANNPLQPVATKLQDDEPQPNDPNPFVGLWRTTSAQTTFYLEIRADGTCLLVYIGEDSTAQQAKWKELPGGIIVNTLPRFRFWTGRNDTEARVEIETLPADMTSSDIREFPRTFFMLRTESDPTLLPGLDQAYSSRCFGVAPIQFMWHDALLD